MSADASQPSPAPTAPEQPVSWSAHVATGLRELGPVVGAMGLLSVTLPGILGTVVLAGSAFGPERVRELIEGFGPNAPIFVAIGMMLATGSALLPTYALSFMCGAVFLVFAEDGGVAMGPSMVKAGTVAMVGVVGGGLVGYFWGALLARKRVMEVFGRHERAALIRRALVDRTLRDEFLAVGLIRFPPSSPFALTNFVMSSCAVRLFPYVVGTLVGIAPRTLVAVWLGVSVGDLAEAQSAGGRMRVVVTVVVGLATFVVIYKLMSRWANQALAEHAAEDGSGREPE